jgi:hypothetical protein
MLTRTRLALVRKSPPLARLDEALRAMRDPTYRKRLDEEALALSRLKAAVGDRFANAARAPGGRSVVMFGFCRVDTAVLERIVTAAFEHAGMSPVMVGPWFARGAAAYRSLGLGDMRPFVPFISARVRETARRAIAGMTEESELHAFTYEGVPCGKITLSSIMRSHRRGSFDLTDADTREMLAGALARSIAAVEAGRVMLAKHRPAAVILSDRGYTPFGEVFYLGIADDIPVFTWNVAHRYGLIVMKRFGRHNTHVHHHSLSPASWEKISQLPWRDEFRAASERELVDSYTSGEWYGEVGTQFHTKSVEKRALCERLGLDPTKRTAVVFPHIFWDGTFFWGEDLFDDYEQWYCEVLKVARRNTHLNWVIKVHPANIVKNVRDKQTAEHSEVTALRRVLGETPDHIHLIEAASDISTLSLFSVMDYCLTVRGTIGIEAAYRGIPVLTAGTGRYDRLGFTLDFDDRESYLACLEKLETVPSLTPEQCDLARKYAFGTFSLRPTPLASVKFMFHQDEVASLEASFTVADAAALAAAPDVADLGAWIRSGADDYLNWALTGETGEQTGAPC